MPDPASSPRPATRSSRARPPWRPTARGWCRRTRRPASTSAIAPLPKGPAGRFTSVNPTGAVVYKGTKAPDAAWEFVKYLASPAAQEQLMQLKASLPVNKEVLAGPYATSFDGRAGVRRQPRVREAQAVVQGLRRVLDDAPGRARRRTCSTPRTRRRKDGAGVRRAAAQRPAGRPVAVRWPSPIRLGAVAPRRRRRAARRAEGSGGRCCSWRPPSSAWRCCRPGRSSRSFGDQPHEVGPADAAPVRRPRQLHQPAQRLAVPDRAPQHRRSTRCCRCRSGMVARAGPRARAQPAAPRHRVDPDGVLPAGRDLDDRGRPRLGVDLQPGERAAQPGPSGSSGSRPRSGSPTRSGRCPSIIAMSVWQGLGINVIIFLAGLQAIPQEYYDAASVDGAGALVALPARDAAAAHAEHLLHRDPVAHRVVPGLRPGLHPGPARASRRRRRSRSSTSSTRAGFKFFRMGEAAAASWILFLIVAVADRHLLPLAEAAGSTTSDDAGSQAVAVTLARSRSAGAARPAGGIRAAGGPCSTRPDRRRDPDDGPVPVDGR